MTDQLYKAALARLIRSVHCSAGQHLLAIRLMVRGMQP